MKVKESKKAGLKLSVQKNKKIMASSSITSWQIDGETMETVTGFIFLDSKITAGGNCSHEIKGYLLLERKAVTNLDSILKSRDITLPTKVCIFNAMVFPVVMYGCKSWTIRKVECWRTDAFKLWKNLLRVPWTAGRSNQSILKEINPEYSLEGLMLKLTVQYSGYLMQRADSLEKTLMLGKIEGRSDAWKDWGQEEKGVTEKMVGWHQWLNGHEFEQTSGDGEGQWSLVSCSPSDQSRTQLSDWTTTICKIDG